MKNFLKDNFILIIIIGIGAILRFYKLDWGQGYFFHPDEYHISISVNQLSFPDNLHPNLFSYGSLNVYLIFLSKLLLNSVFEINASVFLIGRFISATYSTMTIYLVYKISQDILEENRLSYLAAFSTAMFPGLIQQAHFATPESAITFWMLLGLLLAIKYLKKPTLTNTLSTGASVGLAAATKITSVLTLPGPVIAYLYKNLPKKKYKKLLITMFVFMVGVGVFYFISFPYSILDYEGFRHSMNYETDVGRGVQKVFYTRSFLSTIPVVFQFRKILYYAIDPVNLIFGSVGYFFMIIYFLKDKNKTTKVRCLIILFYFTSYFMFNSFLYAKWTRFIAPTFPYFALFSAFVLKKTNQKNKYGTRVLEILTVISSIVWMTMFYSIYLNSDVRLQTTNWIIKSLSRDSYVLTEAGNVLEVPLKGGYKKKHFDFYHLDEYPQLKYELVRELENADYFIIQSRRMFMNHPKNSFPITGNFYEKLSNGDLGFEKIKQFSSFPTLPFANIQINDEKAEETWSVFDHPVIRIYKKVNYYDEKTYKEILNIR